ncbi:alpha/beta hydrolase [Microaerobacter geothermalis]|uniref:intracellular short-chain-length polyhydroxyalkanoate depolymerase n=1 Tax=Microaerobacter geothermalis TaxID=674972 RepID=UPI001F292CEE|nr:alpha/beta hydrolase [Microaerobacter geothermalis]MCF6092803.1 alpha/beta hydrolase [Microaerobacter geothermalis]
MINLKSINLDNGETLGYREREGGEKVLVLIHGNMTSSKHWDLVMENIDPGFKVYAVDLRGFGISTYNKPIDSLKDFSDDVKLFVDALGLKDFALMGWSTGGGVSMQFVADHPGYVNRLILLASASTRGYPFYRSDKNGMPLLDQRLNTKEDIAADQARTIPILTAYENRDKNFLKALWNAVIYTRHQPDEARYDAYLEDMLTQRNLVDVYYALNSFNISNQHNGLVEGTGDVANIQVPTLVLWGRNDLVVTEQMTLEIMEDMGPNARLVYLEGCGHSPLVDDLDQLLNEVTNFLD